MGGGSSKTATSRASPVVESVDAVRTVSVEGTKRGQSQRQALDEDYSHDFVSPADNVRAALEEQRRKRDSPVITQDSEQTGAPGMDMELPERQDQVDRVAAKIRSFSNPVTGTLSRTSSSVMPDHASSTILPTMRAMQISLEAETQSIKFQLEKLQELVVHNKETSELQKAVTSMNSAEQHYKDEEARTERLQDHLKQEHARAQTQIVDKLRMLQEKEDAVAVQAEQLILVGLKAALPEKITVGGAKAAAALEELRSQQREAVERLARDDIQKVIHEREVLRAQLQATEASTSTSQSEQQEAARAVDAAMKELQRQVEQLQTDKQEMRSKNEALANEKQALEQQIQSRKLESCQLQELQAKFDSEREQLENNLKLEKDECRRTKDALTQAVRQLNQLKQEQGADAQAISC